MLKSIKNGLYVVSGPLLRIVIFLAITASVIVVIFGNQATLKLILQKTNSYSRFIPSVIEENVKNTPVNSAFSYEDPEIVAVITSSFPARDLRRNTEQFIDSVYLWLNGTTEKLTFTVDFTKNKQQFAAGLADYAFNKLERLPVCKQAPPELDPLTATCRPKNLNLLESKKVYEKQINDSDSVLQKTLFTENDLPRNASGQTIAEQFHYAPQIFTWLKRSPYILGIASVILAIDFIILSPRKRKGIVSLSRILMGSGISIIIFPLFFSYVLPYFAKTLQFNSGVGGTQKIFSEIIDQLGNNVDILFILIGSGVAIAGFILYGIERITRPTTKYTGLEKKSGVAVSAKKSEPTPKSLKGKLTQETVPVQSSDDPTKKRMKGKNKYRTLMNKKDF